MTAVILLFFNSLVCGVIYSVFKILLGYSVIKTYYNLTSNLEVNLVYMNNQSRLKYPKISIITPSLNQGQFIDETIRSVLSQNYPDLEYIILDGGSSDNTLSVLESYSDRITWISEKDDGQTSAINKGLQMATGEIVAYLNADDLLLPGTLLKVAKRFMDDTRVMWVTGKCKIIDENGVEIRQWITAYKNLCLQMHSRSLLLVMDYISQPATFWRIDVFKRFGPLDESLHFAMDYEYWLRISEKNPLVIIPENLAAFRVHLHSKNMNSGHKKIYVDEEKKIIRQYTNSRILQFMHGLHRLLMTTVYSTLVRR